MGSKSSGRDRSPRHGLAPTIDAAAKVRRPLHPAAMDGQEGLVRMDEQALIARARTGDPDAFNVLVRTYQDMAYNVAYRVLGRPDAAADATQDAFLSAYRALAAFRGGSFKAWLLRIVTNACYDQLRAQRRRPQTSLEDVSEDPDYAAPLTDRAESPEEAVMRQDLAQILEAGIAKLPVAQRLALVLSDVEGFSYDEIATVTGVSLGTVKSRLNRARAKLRSYLTSGREPWMG